MAHIQKNLAVKKQQKEKKSLTHKKENVQMVKSAFEIIDWIQLNTFHRGCKLMFMTHENVDTKMLGDALMTPSFNRIMYIDEENILVSRQKKRDNLNNKMSKDVN